ncbi:MAG: hypothetical protein WCY11_06025 [Novosphingobium sp.]
MRLQDICQLQTGYTVRGRLEPARGDGQLCVQLRDLLDGGSLDARNLQRFDLGQLPDRYAVKPGDVVFKSRGEPNIACAISADMIEPAIALLPLIILRPKTGLVSAEYLAWAINQPDAQRQMDAEAQGTSLRMISKSSLENIEVPVPDIKTQVLIVQVGQLAARETALLHELADKRHTLSSLILADLANAARGGAQLKGAHQ